MKQYYYQVVGKYGRMPLMYYTKADSQAQAKINFYLATPGTDIDYILRIGKDQFLNRTKTGRVTY
jgi:hypothetical protein